MSDYTDYFFDSPDAALFLPLMAEEANLLGPCHGVAAHTPPEGLVDEVGQSVPTQSARGDPARVYIGVRTSRVLHVPEGAGATDPDLARSILGVWA